MAEKELHPGDDAEEGVVIDLDDDDTVDEVVEDIAKEDKTLKAGDDDDDDEDDDSDPATAEKRKARAAERKRKREKARADKEAAQREIAALKRENAEILRRMENVDKRTASQDLSQIDAALTQAAQAAAQAEKDIAEAVTAGDGMRVVENQRKWYQAAEATKQLQEIKKRAQQQPTPQQGVDPVLRANYEAWQARNPWYDINRKDPDSAVTYAVDNALAAEGWNPRDPGYWDELDNRLKKYVPHRFAANDAPADEDEEPRARPKPPTGGTPRNTAAKPGQISLPAEYVRSLKEAGLWDDIETRKRMAKRYRDQLKETNNGTR